MSEFYLCAKIETEIVVEVVFTRSLATTSYRHSQTKITVSRAASQKLIFIQRAPSPAAPTTSTAGTSTHSATTLVQRIPFTNEFTPFPHSTPDSSICQCFFTISMGGSSLKSTNIPATILGHKKGNSVGKQKCMYLYGLSKASHVDKRMTYRYILIFPRHNIHLFSTYHHKSPHQIHIVHDHQNCPNEIRLYRQNHYGI